MFQIRPHGRCGLDSQRRHPLLVALAAADAVAFLQVQIVELEVREFRRPAAGGVEQFQERPIAPPAEVARLGRLEEAVDLGRREDLRHSLPQLLTAQQFGLAVDQDAFKLQIAEEDPQRRDVPGDARGAQLPLVQPIDVIGQVADRERRYRAGLQPLEEPRGVAAVGGHGVVGQVTFARRVGDERLQVGCRDRHGGRRAGTQRLLGNEGHDLSFGPAAWLT